MNYLDVRVEVYKPGRLYECPLWGRIRAHRWVMFESMGFRLVG